MMVGQQEVILSRVLILPISLPAFDEMIAVKNKAQVGVFAGIKNIKERLPFSILGLDLR